ncbi:MAG: response regulator [Aliarcobacter sp.]|nr:response regulator [Aliarcobacter sp.]
MTLNEKLFKTLNILYVENDEKIKETFSPTLNKLFKKVFFCTDGLSALEQFTKLNNSEEKIDVILSEYTIPSLNGLELLLKIRDISKNVPFIFVTQETNVDLLLNSLRYDVTDYFFKPINEYEILKKIEEACIARQEEDEILNYQNEIEEYLELINKVAIVYSFDTNRAMIYVNNLFKELIKYDEDEILGQDYRSFFHNEMPKVIIEEQGQILQSGNKWQGKMKYLTSIDSIFYTNCTIIPVFDENKNIRKYVSVNFLTTKEENDKREFKKRVLVDIQETKRIYSIAQRKIDELTNILTSFDDYDELKKNLDEEQKLNQNYYTELEELENKVKIVKDKYELLTVGINKKINQISLMTSEMKSAEQRTNNKIINVVEDIKTKDSLIVKIKNEIDIKGTKISDLEEVLEHRKTQIENKKAKS